MRPVSWQVRPALSNNTFADGTSHTMLLAEKYSRCGRGGNLWGHTQPDEWLATFAAWSGDPFQVRPQPGECDPKRASTASSAGILVGMADGSVRTVNAGVSARTWWAACTPSGGEVIGGDF